MGLSTVSPSVEKNIVLNLLNMAATGEVEYGTRPGTSNRRYSYWSHRDSLDGPRSRDSWRPRSHSYDATMTDPAAEFNFLPLPSGKYTEDKGLERGESVVTGLRVKLSSLDQPAIFN